MKITVVLLVIISLMTFGIIVWRQSGLEDRKYSAFCKRSVQLVELSAWSGNCARNGPSTEVTPVTDSVTCLSVTNTVKTHASTVSSLSKRRSDMPMPERALAGTTNRQREAGLCYKLVEGKLVLGFLDKKNGFIPKTPETVIDLTHSSPISLRYPVVPNSITSVTSVITNRRGRVMRMSYDAETGKLQYEMLRDGRIGIRR